MTLKLTLSVPPGIHASWPEGLLLRASSQAELAPEGPIFKGSGGLSWQLLAHGVDPGT